MPAHGPCLAYPRDQGSSQTPNVPGPGIPAVDSEVRSGGHMVPPRAALKPCHH